MTLVEFLRARLDMEAEIAREATPGPWQNAPTPRHRPTTSGRSEEAVFASPPDMGTVVVATTGEPSERRNLVNAEHIARWDPARVLAEVEAKRRIVDRCEYEMSGYAGTGAQVATPHLVLRLLALPYAAHPEYDPAWRP